MTRAALAALLLSCAARAAAPAAPAAAPTAAPADQASLLRDAFGDSGVEALGRRGVLVLQGKPGARRVAAVHWKALESLAKAAPSCLKLAAAADALGKEPAPATGDAGFGACRALPPEGLMTPSLQGVAAALEARHQELWGLARAGGALAGPAGKPNALDTPWGKALIARRHADALEDPDPVVPLLFEERLASPAPDADAAALLAAEAAQRGAAAPAVLIATDAAKGALSLELRGQLRRSLADQRRRWGAEQARARAAELLGKSAVRQDLEDLRGVARALAAKPALAAALEAASARGAASGAPHLRSAGLHLREPVRLGQYELGDEAVVSGAYWVDGLPEGGSADVEETTVLETERGFEGAETRRVSRRNGGPYVYERSARIERPGSFAARSFISAEGAAAAERVEVPVARDFELAVRKEADALALRGACRLKEAAAAADALAALAAEPAKAKPQYKALVERARKLGDAARADAASLEKLERALADARADSAPERCRYDGKATTEALRLARDLPPGCDRDVPELLSLQAASQRRAADQSWFLKASSDARSKRRSCELDEARRRWAEALAALDADPGARCGDAAAEAGRAKTELAETARELAWRDELQRALTQAEAEAQPEKRLERAHAALARLGSIAGSCLRPEQKRASALAESAGKALGAPSDEDLRRRLPADASLAAVVAEVRSERARRLDASAAAERATVEPGRSAAAPNPGEIQVTPPPPATGAPPPPEPAPKAAAKPAPKASAKAAAKAAPKPAAKPARRPAAKRPARKTKAPAAKPAPKTEAAQ